LIAWGNVGAGLSNSAGRKLWDVTDADAVQYSNARVSNVPHILLTGAGFSKNWGGLLAGEFFSRLLGEEELDSKTRGLMFEARRHGGFERVMAVLQAEHQALNTEDSKTRLHRFTAALLGIFNGMNNNFVYGPFEFQNQVQYLVRSFLERFDIIFTLNQDALLEAHYFQGFVGGRWSGAELPGTKGFGPPPHTQGGVFDRISKRTSDLGNLRIGGNQQPYVKLHGSANWVVDERSGPLLILGGDKQQALQQHPLLVRYQEIFAEHLSRKGTRLMIIGYGFNDEHINEAILAGIKTGLKIFIVDLHGVDVIEKIDTDKTVRPSIIGESTKPLSQTFGSDHVEHGHLISFFKG
jgi:hypothetical protein